MTKSIQTELQDVSPARVKITYDVSTGGIVEKKELPFVIAVLADLSANRDPAIARSPLKLRPMISLDRDNFDAVIAQHQPLESTKRGLAHLVAQLDTREMLRVKILDATKQELLDDLSKALAFDQSVLFKRLYEASYGAFGGVPFSLIVGDYDIGRTAQDINFLTKISQIAASAHAPFISAASAQLFGLDSFDDLHKPRYLAKIFESVELTDFFDFRGCSDSRYAALTVPPAAFGNAAYALAARIGQAFAQYAWPVKFTDFEDAGFAPVVEITTRRAQELAELGFIPLCVRTGTTQTAFIGAHSAQLPTKYTTDDANANAKISALLPFVLVASRFAHYLKVIMREKIGSFLTRGNIEAYLNSWISQYVLLVENASEAVNAAFPLRAANVVVTEVAGSPGAYQATIFIKPHFQLEELTTSIRLVVSIPA
jgi:type VI secretion system protein ImpC